MRVVIAAGTRAPPEDRPRQGRLARAAPAAARERRGPCGAATSREVTLGGSLASAAMTSGGRRPVRPFLPPRDAAAAARFSALTGGRGRGSSRVCPGGGDVKRGEDRADRARV